MSNDFAVDPQASEVDLPEAWREHVRELRAENARRRKENQELRAQLAGLSEGVRAAEEAQAAVRAHSERERSRLKATQQRLKELELARQQRAALDAVVSRRGQGSEAVDVARAQRLLERVPAPVNPALDMSVDDEGRVALEPAASERLRGFVEEMVELVTARREVAPPPVGGEPPRAAGAPGPVRNAWDPEGQRSPSAKARATLRQAAAGQAATLDELV